MKIRKYKNGDEIPNVQGSSEWENLSTGAYANYGSSSEIAEIYGKHYNWYTINDERCICPEGWYVPTDDDIKQIEAFLGMSQEEAGEDGSRGTNEGSKLANRKDLWDDGILKNNPEFGTSGFDFLPGGYRINFIQYSDSGNYSGMGYHGSFWSSTESTNYDELVSYNEFLEKCYFYLALQLNYFFFLI